MSPRGWKNQMTNGKAAAKIYQHLALGEQQFPSLFKQLLKLFKQPACSSSSSSTMSARGTLNNTVAKVIKFLLYKNLNSYTQWRQKGWDDSEQLKLHKRMRGKEGYRNTCADVYLSIKGACVSLQNSATTMGVTCWRSSLTQQLSTAEISMPLSAYCRPCSSPFPYLRLTFFKSSSLQETTTFQLVTYSPTLTWSLTVRTKTSYLLLGFNHYNARAHLPMCKRSSPWHYFPGAPSLHPSLVLPKTVIGLKKLKKAREFLPPIPEW